MRLVTRKGTRPLAAFAAAALAALLLVACGGSSSDSSSTVSNEASGTARADTTAQAGSQKDSSQGEPERKGPQGQNSGQKQGGDQSKHVQGQQPDSGGSGRKKVETPLKVSGGGSQQFRSNGGDNSIQEFGQESGESELREAAEVVHGFYVSRAAQEWDKACSYLSKSNIAQLEQLANQSAKSEGADCATVLKAFTRPLPTSVEREITTVDAGSLRREGSQGFLIYYGAGHVKYAMPLKDEGGTWKVTALSGTTLG
jgi:hypothetical protein